ncbi:hypothetical protein CBA19CS22_17830 [Caballeronia novacaledonica]|uniref:Uncharacterized protein n=1 Tax=Caballeronia novacaledonica TaxID=1544861 RepID=A0ACB5QUE3_9BURK|nr:hypothetical protein CBA19CS22_17830 [Caballeronia novacaledonica]
MDERGSDQSKFFAFLSYGSCDRILAKWLHAKLERYRVPRRLVGQCGRHGTVPARLMPIFRDRDDARAANDIETTIKGYLDKSEQLIVLCTPSATGPKSWVGREIELFRSEKPSGEIHAIIGAGEPPDCFPKQLLCESRDGCIHAPLAADLRPIAAGGDGTRRGLIKLVAALIGVEFDELWQRDRRRHQLRTILASVVVAAALIVGSLWIMDRESARLARIASVAQNVDPATNGALIDLLTIAAAPPAIGAMSAPSDRQRGGVEEIARREQSSYAGSVAMRQNFHAAVEFRSRDGRLLFTSHFSDEIIDPQMSLFVWHVVTNRLVARVPISAVYWRPTDRRLFEGYENPYAVDVSSDGRLVAAVYRSVKHAPWIFANWQLDEQGTCAAPCLPKIFQFDGPAEESKPSHLHGWPKLQLSPDAMSALLINASETPYAIDLASRKATPFALWSSTDATHCELSIPAPAKREVYSSPSDPLDQGPISNEEERSWLSNDGRFVARVKSATGLVKFYSSANRREVARLSLPGSKRCGSTCPEVIFLDQGDRAAIAEREPLEGEDAPGRVLGIMSLDDCRFDSWPEIGPLSLVSNKIAGLNGEDFSLHRMKFHVASRSGTRIAAVVTLRTSKTYIDVGVIFDVRERRPVALFDLNASSIEGLEATDGEYAFHALTPEGMFPVREDGTVGPFLPVSMSQQPMTFTGNSRLPTWKRRANMTWDETQWYMPEERAPSGFVAIDALAGKILDVAIAANASRLALAQFGVIFVQPANSNALAKAVQIELDAKKYTGIAFSPNTAVLGAAWSSVLGDNTPSTLTIWDSSTGKLLAERALESEAQLFAISNDGKAFIEYSGFAWRVDVKTGERKQILEMKKYWGGGIFWGGAGLVANNHDGHVLTIDPISLTVASAGNLSGDAKHVPGSWGSEERLVAVSHDGKFVFYSLNSEFNLVNLGDGQRSPFYSRIEYRVPVFSYMDDFAIFAGKNMEIWNPVGPTRIALYTVPSNLLLTAWFSPDDRELWALDKDGILYRWNRVNAYESSLTAACAALKSSGARMRFTDDEMTAFPDLSWADRTPCSRAGPLSITYYLRLVRRLFGSAETSHP